MTRVDKALLTNQQSQLTPSKHQSIPRSDGKTLNPPGYKIMYAGGQGYSEILPADLSATSRVRYSLSLVI